MNKTNQALNALFVKARGVFKYHTDQVYVRIDGSCVDIYYIKICRLDLSCNRANEMMWAVEEMKLPLTVTVHAIPTYQPSVLAQRLGAVPFHHALIDTAVAVASCSSS